MEPNNLVIDKYNNSGYKCIMTMQLNFWAPISTAHLVFTNSVQVYCTSMEIYFFDKQQIIEIIEVVLRRLMISIGFKNLVGTCVIDKYGNLVLYVSQRSKELNKKNWQERN